MRIAIQSPHFLFADASRSFTGYDIAFARAHGSVIYLPGWKWRLTRGRGYRALMRRHLLEPDHFDFAFSPSELNRKADTLVCFNYMPHVAGNEPPPRFKGLKVWHTMDFVFNAPRANQALEQGGVSAVMGYCDHSRHSQFFRRHYPRFVDRVISVPFGFASRFHDHPNLGDRIQKVIALGSVNPVAETGFSGVSSLEAYIQFYPGERWTHRWRRVLVENQERLRDIMDSQLPVWPETKNPNYDAVELLNRYAMFANDEGLMAFPPARTYEGMASGSLLVGNMHPSYAEFGIENGVNCLLHRPCDVIDFRERVLAVLSQPGELLRLAMAGKNWVRGRFTHPMIASELCQRLQALWLGKEADAFRSWAMAGKTLL